MVEKASSKGKQSEYHAFMLRLRYQGTHQRWFLTLEDPHTQERHSFKNVELFVVHLLTLIGQGDFDLDRFQQLRRKSR